MEWQAKQIRASQLPNEQHQKKPPAGQTQQALGKVIAIILDSTCVLIEIGRYSQEQ